MHPKLKTRRRHHLRPLLQRAAARGQVRRARDLIERAGGDPSSAQIFPGPRFQSSPIRARAGWLHPVAGVAASRWLGWLHPGGWDGCIPVAVRPWATLTGCDPTPTTNSLCQNSRPWVGFGAGGTLP